MTETFSLIPVASRTPLFNWILFPIILLIIGAVVLLASTLLSIPQIKFIVSPQELKITYPFYGRTIPLQELKLTEARLVNIQKEPDLKPIWRTNGVGLPGFGGGWFKLKNKERALLFLSDTKQAVYLPTTRGYVLLMSPENPKRFLERLKQNNHH